MKWFWTEAPTDFHQKKVFRLPEKCLKTIKPVTLYISYIIISLLL